MTFLNVSCHRQHIVTDEAVAYQMWRPESYPVRLFPKNKTFEMFTRNKELGPYTASFNNEGIRDKNYSLQKPPGSIRIAVLGDSSLFGWGVEQDQTFDNRLEEIYAKKGNTTVEVINLAVPGVNHISELNILKVVGLKYHPDIVLVGVNGDDIFPDNNNRIFGSMPPLPREFVDFSRKDINAVKTEQMKRMSELNTPHALKNSGFLKLWKVFAAEPIKEIHLLSLKHGFKLILMFQVDSPIISFYKSLANQLDIMCIDISNIRLMPYLDGNGSVPVLMIPGDGHPTAESLNFFAKYVADNLELPDIHTINDPKK